MPDPVLYAVDDGVATITLNRPEQANAVDLALAHALSAAVARAASDRAVGAVLLRGSGARFCAGGDLSAMLAAADRSAFLAELAEAIHGAVRGLDALTKPVVGAVQGAAAGVGFSLLLGADIIIATAGTRLLTAYTSVGLTPDGGLSWLLPRTVGQRRASELLLSSRPLNARAAEQLGIVSSVCAEDELEDRARAAAIELAQRPTHALGQTRRLVRGAWGRSFGEQLDLEVETIAAAGGRSETAELITRFLGGGR